jgi:peptidoglycan-N-acetylglucosamine deacetylase
MPPLYGSTGPSRTSTAVAGYAVPYPGAPAVKPVEIRMFHPRHKWIALTFDDGWALDPRILLLLEREHIQVTTFIAGRVIETDPAYVLRMQADGFEICDHTFSHRRLPTLSDVDIRLELARAQIDISGITGNQAPYMRPPHGDVDARVERIAASMGYRTVLWTRSLHDTERTTTVEGAYHAAIDGLKPGEIIAAHWDGYVTYEALLRIIPELRRRGFEFVTVSGLLHDSGGPAARR